MKSRREDPLVETLSIEPDEHDLSLWFGASVNDQCKPERKLLTGILLRAIHDYTRMYVRKGSNTLMVSSGNTATAEEWLFDEGRDDEFSYVWVCEHLDIEPDCLRERLRMIRDLVKSGVSVHRSTAHRADLEKVMTEKLKLIRGE